MRIPRAPMLLSRLLGSQWVFTLNLVLVLTIALLATFACNIAEVSLAYHFPRAAWRYGTAKMQARAMPLLAKEVRVGMPFSKVLDILGPGSRNWPAVKGYKLQMEDNEAPDVVSFNVRADYMLGIDVYLRSGRVYEVRGYD